MTPKLNGKLLRNQIGAMTDIVEGLLGKTLQTEKDFKIILIIFTKKTYLGEHAAEIMKRP